MDPKIFAHRGASKRAPENTMHAFKLAYFLGAQGIETDVQLTKDDIPVLIHDEQVTRTTNRTGYVKDFTFNQLKQLDAGSWFAQEYRGTTIVSLDEFLQWIHDKPLYLNIELKNNKINYKNLEAIVYERIDYYQLVNRTIFSTFNPNSVKRLREFNDIETAFLTLQKNKNLVSYALELGANAIHIKYRLLHQTLVKKAHKENMPIRIFTVNKFAHVKKCFSFGCDAIFTDVPDKILKYRQRLYKNERKIKQKP
ncbi:glycerophosphodiester phosphodiesterase [Virgibacillus sp. NKC19-3]|uniref:glycerophosphodiester phosphodiesterase n=1 Tax=Virgibacillus saliphilus TaxID=2831674 RepID=UPI001C9B507C|nr:glycerophosphodiester phosphodiesterase [Virgibacillus sp. NKC19-3]MBY7143430.1 glycerophosphodiester phosphodiesterase [Virgibacillus sp. NKC19-3]